MSNCKDFLETRVKLKMAENGFKKTVLTDLESDSQARNGPIMLYRGAVKVLCGQVHLTKEEADSNFHPGK